MIGLAFSGGKDSWACLYLYLDRIEEITVLWVNAGKNYPAALEMIEKAKALCPNFIEIPSDRDRQNREHGIPADVVPINFTNMGQQVRGYKPIAIQSYLGCCFDNISKPLNEKVKELGITQLISGQRADEAHKSQHRNEAVIDGVEHIFPLENWTRKEVMDYLYTKMEIPDHFNLNHSSLDCYDCPAYLEESLDRLQWAKERYPELHAKNMARIEHLRRATASAASRLYYLEGIDNG